MSWRDEKFRIAAVLGIFALAFVALQVGSYTRQSATWDEPIHVAMGYAALTERDFRVDPEHPPLLRLWNAIPLLFIDDVVLDRTAIDAAPANRWALANLFSYCHGFLYDSNDADRLLYPARFMTVVLGVLLGVLLFFWAWEWFGWWPALVVLLLAAVEPNIAAHSSLVTTDLGLTFFFAGALYFLWRTCRNQSLFNLGGLVVFVALAAASKYSALVLALLVPLLLAVSVARGSIAYRRALSVVALLTVTTFIAVWASYGFRYAPSASRDWLYRFEDVRQVQENVPVLASVVGWIDGARLLPNAFSQGLLLNQAKAQERPAYLLGGYSETGWWYYFPLAFLMKTPVGLLLLFFCGIVLWARPRGDDRAAFVSVSLLVFLAVAMTSRMNIGLRHILPVYPLVLVMAGAGAKALLDRFRENGAIAVAVLSMWAAVEFAVAYPHTLAFFNQAVGGARDGASYLVDSNLDWGQDLKPLKGWMDEQGISHVNLAYFGSADPGYYGIDYTALTGSSEIWADTIEEPELPGYVAVSATVLVGVYFDQELREFYRPLREREPVARIGKSIYVYRVEEPWW